MGEEKTLGEYEKDLEDRSPPGVDFALKFLLQEVCLRLRAIEIELAKIRQKG